VRWPVIGAVAGVLSALFVVSSVLGSFGSVLGGKLRQRWQRPGLRRTRHTMSRTPSSLRKYGLTVAEDDEMVEGQDGRNLIRGTTEPGPRRATGQSITTTPRNECEHCCVATATLASGCPLTTRPTPGAG
jgi:hypothetical protein